MSNPEHVEKGVRAVAVDGRAADHIPVFTEGVHEVRVLMGPVGQ